MLSCSNVNQMDSIEHARRKKKCKTNFSIRNLCRKNIWEKARKKNNFNLIKLLIRCPTSKKTFPFYDPPYNRNNRKTNIYFITTELDMLAILILASSHPIARAPTAKNAFMGPSFPSAPILTSRYFYWREFIALRCVYNFKLGFSEGSPECCQYLHDIFY